MEFLKRFYLIGSVPRPVITATDHVTLHVIIRVQVQVQIVQGRVGIGLRCLHSLFDLLFGFLFDTLQEKNNYTSSSIETALLFFNGTV